MNHMVLASFRYDRLCCNYWKYKKKLCKNCLKTLRFNGCIRNVDVNISETVQVINLQLLHNKLHSCSLCMD